MSTELQKHIQYIEARLDYGSNSMKESIDAVIAAAERCEAALDNTKDDATINVRLFDLVRYMRSELMEANLITCEEYAWLCGISELAQGQGSPSPRRLESYGETRKRTESAEALCVRMRNVVNSIKNLVRHIVERSNTTGFPWDRFHQVEDEWSAILLKTPADMGKELAELRKDKARLDFLIKYLQIDDVGDERTCLGVCAKWEALEWALSFEPTANNQGERKCLVESWDDDMRTIIDKAIDAVRKEGGK